MHEQTGARTPIGAAWAAEAAEQMVIVLLSFVQKMNIAGDQRKIV